MDKHIPVAASCSSIWLRNLQTPGCEAGNTGVGWVQPVSNPAVAYCTGAYKAYCTWDEWACLHVVHNECGVTWVMECQGETKKMELESPVECDTQQGCHVKCDR